MSKHISLVALAVLSICTEAHAGSSLFGDEGELWQPRGRLPDFSYAGYRAGRERIPRVRVVVNARDFGAEGNGSGDQTRAIQRAIDAAAAAGGAVSLGAGRYRIEGRLHLDKSNVVLRGAGPNDTTLFFVNSLKDLHGFDIATANGEGGLVQFGNKTDATYERVADIDAIARRGDRSIVLKRNAESEGISRGKVLRIQMEPNDLSLWNHMHNDQNPHPDAAGPGSCDDARATLGTWVGVVAAVDGKRVTFDQPLRIDIRPEWHPTIQLVRAVHDVGIEDLRIEFERKPHKPHHQEPGYNAIAFDEGVVVDGWVKSVRIHNADNGINLASSKRVTVDDVRITADRDCSSTPGEGQFGCTTGHHALHGGIDSLLESVDIDTNFIHELTFAERTSGTVCSRCGGSVRWSIDHHGRGQFDNLVTQMRSSYDYEGGGGACRPQAGARNVQWGFSHALRTPPWLSMQTTIVGDLAAGVDEKKTTNGAFVEQVRDPGNLYDLQLERRRSIENMGRFADGDFGVRTAFSESAADRFALHTGGDRAYAILSTVYEMGPGNTLGARALAKTAPLEDSSITARARSTEPADHGNADFALVLAASGDRSYYALFTRAPGKSGIFLARGNDRRRIASADGRGIVGDRWHHVSFERRGDRLTMRRDGEILADVRDATLGAGRAGLGSLNDAVQFDDISVLDAGDPARVLFRSDLDLDIAVDATEAPAAIALEPHVDADDFGDDFADEGPALADDAADAGGDVGCAAAPAGPCALMLLALRRRQSRPRAARQVFV